MPKLRRLSIRGCLVSDKGISRIVSALPGLNVLRIARCVFLTDRSLHSIGSNLRCLQHIDIDGCPKITEAGRKHLLTKLPHVRFLNEG
ncbi:hypothetical protein HPB48_016541 [Haemaphysalis longicornis]|uniref:Uncharacterized protein n=1 Tax=Haemaphysalis longicornis TaxID=44386 RepID=A0A9J6GDQ9_HAELO|nr:hypothetical protein HPB48_016541 [Haemaphysalis longicornis]